MHKDNLEFLFIKNKLFENVNIIKKLAKTKKKDF